MPVIKKQKKPRRWKGKLAQRIHPRVIRPLDLCAIKDDETLIRANRRMIELHQEAIETGYNERLKLLMKRYKISDGDYRSLAIELAKEAGIKGFEVENNLFEIESGWGLVSLYEKVGAPDAWTMERLGELLVAVKDTKDKLKLSRMSTL